MEQKPIFEKDATIMLGVPDEDLDGVELATHRAMIYLPEDAVEVEINAKVFKDGSLIDVMNKMTMKDLREAFRKADDGYVDEDDEFVLTDKGRQYLEELNRSI